MVFVSSSQTKSFTQKRSAFCAGTPLAVKRSPCARRQPAQKISALLWKACALFFQLITGFDHAAHIAALPAGDSSSQALCCNSNRQFAGGRLRACGDEQRPVQSPSVQVVWTQDVDEVAIGVPIDDTVKASDIEFEIHPRRLRLAVHGELVLNGSLEGAGVADPEGSFFSLEERNGERMCVLTVLKKEMGADSWPALFEDDKPDDSVTHQVFMDVTIDGEEQARMVFGLFGREVPRTVANFVSLCTGDKGDSLDGTVLCYRDSTFHRIIPGFMAQGGDITNGDGTGGMSIYGRKFEDEKLRLKHDRPGLLSMANAGPDTNNSQFFITFVDCPHLDGNGLRTVNKIEHIAGSDTGQPKVEVVVRNCGALEPQDFVKPEPSAV